jgi:hypothetical protein
MHYESMMMHELAAELSNGRRCPGPSATATACSMTRQNCSHQGLGSLHLRYITIATSSTFPSLSPLSRTRVGLTAPWKEGGACTRLLSRGSTTGCRACSSSTRRASLTIRQVNRSPGSSFIRRFYVDVLHPPHLLVLLFWFLQANGFC